MSLVASPVYLYHCLEDFEINYDAVHCIMDSL